MIDFNTLDDRHAHDLLTSAIIPRPIAWVTTVNLKGEHNLAPFSFFTGITWRPPAIAVSIVNRGDGSEKDSLRNIRETREFVVNSVSVEHGKRMTGTAEALPPGTDEAYRGGIETIPSSRTRPRRVKDARIAFECGVRDIVTVGEGPSAGNLVIGSVLVMHVDREILIDGREISWLGLDSLGRLSGNRFCAVRSVIEI